MSYDLNKEHVCSLCGKHFYGWGSNPYPLIENPQAVCCKSCDEEYVIPTRLMMAQGFLPNRELDETRKKAQRSFYHFLWKLHPTFFISVGQEYFSSMAQNAYIIEPQRRIYH